ncbi:MAG TPA: hypothetical protein VGC79_23505 [Polyangiaceae bacterium]
MNNARIDTRHRDPQQALALAPEARVEPWRDPEWQRLWLAIESQPWRSLALVPASQGAALEFSLIVAVTLSRTGMIHLGRPLQVADATQVPLDQLVRFLSEVRRCTNDGERLLVALPPIGNSPITTSIAQTVDAALLCVLMGKMSFGQGKKTVQQVGHSRFLGSAIFHPHQIGEAANAI